MQKNGRKNMKIKILSLIVLGALLFTSCATSAAEEVTTPPAVNAIATDTDQNTSESSVSTTTVSFSKDIWPVIQQFALPAHGTEMKGGVSLASYEDIMKYIVPGDPAASELYKRLTGDGVPMMPPSGKLPDATIQLFYDWIAQGAQNN
jgi:hypothetical protein